MISRHVTVRIISRVLFKKNITFTILSQEVLDNRLIRNNFNDKFKLKIVTICHLRFIVKIS